MWVVIIDNNVKQIIRLFYWLFIVYKEFKVNIKMKMWVIIIDNNVKHIIRLFYRYSD